MRAIVYLIGAGPGAPDLISLRGHRCLQKADVVIFDHLVHPDLLAVAPQHAERIGCDAIVMGRHGKTTLGDMLVGSVAMKVLHASRLPVMLVR